MDKSKIYIDLSKCSDEQTKHIFSLLPKPLNYDDYDITERHIYLLYDEDDEHWWVANKKYTNHKIEITLSEFRKLFEGGEEERPYKPMSELPPRVEGEDFSKSVLVFDKDLEDCDLGFYNFDTQKWDVLGGFQMDLICWRHIEKPMYEDVQEYQAILTD